MQPAAQRRFALLLWFLAAALSAGAVLVTAGRLMMPLFAHYPHAIERAIGHYIGQEVCIGTVRASWHHFTPRIELTDVEVRRADTHGAALRLSRAYVEVDLLSSLASGQIRPSRLVMVGLALTVRRLAGGGLSLDGLDAEGRDGHGAAAWLLKHGDLGVDDGRILWCDERVAGPCLAVQDINLRLHNNGQRHQIQAVGKLPAEMGARVELAADVEGDLARPDTWRGQFHWGGSSLQLAGWQHRLGGLAGLPETARLSGSVDLTLRASWRGAGLRSLSGDVSGSDLLVQPPGGHAPMRFSRVSGKLDWRRADAGWTLSVQRLNVSRAQSSWPTSRVVLHAEPGRLAFTTTFLRIQDVTELLTTLGAVPSRLSRLVADLQLAGDVYELRLSYPTGLPSAMALEGRFVDLGIRPHGVLPGVQGADGHLRLDSSGGELALTSRGLTVLDDRLFRDPIPVESLTGTLRWQRDAQGWSLFSDGLAMHNEDFTASTRFWAQIPADGSSPFVALLASFQDGRADRIRRYVPARALRPRAVQWLDRAFVSGRITGGEAVLHGRLADFPFDSGNGRFEVRFHVADAELEYHPQWPKLKDLEADVDFRGRRLEVASHSCKMFASAVQEASVTIPDLTAHPSVLELNGSAVGPTQDVLRLLNNTPLRKHFARYLQGVSASGTSALQLRLSLPLAHSHSRVEGRLTLHDSDIDFAAQRLRLTQANGGIRFTENSVRAEHLRARLWDEDVLLSIRTDPTSQPGTTIVRARGTMDMAEIRNHEPLRILDFLSGRGDWTGELSLPHDPAKPAQLSIESSLRGITVRLPVPLDKAASAEVPLHLTRTFGPTKERLAFHYGNVAGGEFLLHPGPRGAEVERGELRLGGGTAQTPRSPGIRLVGETQRLALEPWLKLVATTVSNQDHQSLFTALRVVQLQCGELSALGQTLHAVSVNATKTDTGWAGKLTAEETAGDFYLRQRLARATVSLSLDRLRLVADNWPPGDWADLDVARTPGLQITAKHLYVGAEDLGELVLTAVPHGREVRLDRLEVDGPAGHLEAHGRWSTNGSRPRSEVDLTLHTPNLGRLLELFEFASPLEGGKATIKTHASWPGTPSHFTLGTVRGNVDLRIRDGRLLRMEPGVGRIFGLLSLQALPRRLTLDFRDVVDKGFAFDRITGSFTIAQGQAYTEGLRMDSPVAHVEVNGRIGLVTQDYDQRATVTPHVTSALPWAAAALSGGIGVGVGAALYLVQKLFNNPLDRITRFQYTLTGSWHSPVVKRVERGAADR